VLAVAQDKQIFVATCVVAGIINGLLTPSLNLLITRLVPVKKRGLAFGIKVAASPAAASLAAMAGYLIAVLDLSWRLLYWTSALAGCFVFVFSLALGPVGAGRRGKGRTRQDARPSRSLKFLGVGGLLGASGTAVLAPFLVEGLVAQGESPASAAGLLAISGWVGIAARVLVGAFSDRLPDPLLHLRATAVMLTAACVGMVGLAVGGAHVALVAATFVAFGLGWSWPGLLQYAAITTHPDNPAAATGFMQTGTFLGALFGPLVFGFVAQQNSFAAAWSIAALSTLLGALLLLAAVRQIRRRSAPPYHGDRDPPRLPVDRPCSQISSTGE
jgi:predicted MFS family arabinose efflux permease